MSVRSWKWLRWMPANARLEPVTAAARQMGTTEPCREVAMTTSHVRAVSGRTGALLGAIAVLVTGCAAAGGGSGPRASRAGGTQDTVAASPSGHIAAHRAAGTTGPGSVRHGSGSRIAWAPTLPRCAHPVGHPVVY